MIKIEIKNRWTGSVIFTYEKENATIKQAVLEAVKSGADLRGAYLSGANLSDADLRGAEEINKAYLPIYCKWSTCIIGDKIKIGCKTATIEEWDLFFSSDEEYETPRGTDDFKRIEAVYLSYKAYLTHLNS